MTSTPHQMDRMSEPEQPGYPTPRPQQRPASNSDARKRAAEREAKP